MRYFARRQYSKTPVRLLLLLFVHPKETYARGLQSQRYEQMTRSTSESEIRRRSSSTRASKNRSKSESKLGGRLPQLSHCKPEVVIAFASCYTCRPLYSRDDKEQLAARPSRKQPTQRQLAETSSSNVVTVEKPTNKADSRSINKCAICISNSRSVANRNCIVQCSM